jgi:diacylglycerol kinase family enzyme
MNVLTIANPISGQGRGPRLAARIGAELSRRGVRSHLVTDRPDTYDFAADADRHGRPDAILVIGGDGTLRAAADQLHRSLGPDLPPLLPLGTANLMVQHLGYRYREPTLVRTVTDALRAGAVRTIDVATLNGSLLLLMASIGVDSWIVHHLSRIRHGPISKFSYVRPAFASLGGYRNVPMTVHVDGVRAFGPTPGMAFVGNVREYGTGFAMLPRARSDDEALDVCVVPCGGSLTAAAVFALAAGGLHLHWPGAVYRKGRRVEITSDRPLPVQVDGDASGFTPASIQLLPWQLPLIVAPSS